MSLVISIHPDYIVIQNSLDITLCYVCQFASIILPYFHMSYIIFFKISETLSMSRGEFRIDF
jgi:hypothetical protein